MTSMLDHALALASIGFPVFPCRESGERAKAPYTEHGSLEATRGERIIREWWEEHPDALIGGKIPSTMLVIDIDPRNGGSHEKLTELVGSLPRTLSVLSGRGDGGEHLYFERPGLERFTSSQLPKGIDLIINGYCIMPPSLHPATGNPYTWVNSDLPAVNLPSSVVQLLTPPPRRARVPGERGNVVGLIATVANADEGERNNLLYWAARTAHEEGAPDEAFEQMAQAAIHAGLREWNARRTIASARGMSGDLDYDN